MKTIISILSFVFVSSAFAAPLYNCTLRISGGVDGATVQLPSDSDHIFRLASDEYVGRYVSVGWNQRTNVLSFRILDEDMENISAASVFVSKVVTLPPTMELKTVALRKDDKSADASLFCGLISQ